MTRFTDGFDRLYAYQTLTALATALYHRFRAMPDLTSFGAQRDGAEPASAVREIGWSLLHRLGTEQA